MNPSKFSFRKFAKNTDYVVTSTLERISKVKDMLQHPPPPDYCRLCVKSCNDDQHSLYDERGQANANHDLVGKYFTNTMLNMEWERRLQYICGKCWQHIWEFHKFQESIIEAQKGLHLLKEVVEVKIKTELNINLQEEQLKLHSSDRLSASTEDSIKPIALFLDIRSEEPLDLNSVRKRMSSQVGQDHRTDEEMSMMMSSRNENSSLQNEDNSNEEYRSSAGITLSSLDQTNISSSICKVPGTKRSVEEFDELVALWRSSLECDICHQLVARYSQLKEHFIKTHASEICYLMCCQLRLETRYDIDRHIRYHNAPQQLKCETCCKVYSSEQYLRSHKRNVHTSKITDKNAKDIHKLQGKYRCCKCSKDFATKLHLYSHNRHVHKPKIFECNSCEKSFRSPDALREHLASHRGEKTYGCSICPKAFTWRSDFWQHMRKSHLQEWKKMQNEAADRKTRKGYRQEIRGESVIYVCIYCSKECNNRTNMYYHAKRCQRYRKGFRLKTRGKSQVHVCIYCAKEFEKRHSIYLHLNQCHIEDGSLAEEQASMMSEPLVPAAEIVEMEPELNKNQQEVQRELHKAMGLGTSNENLVKLTELTFDIKSEEPLDLNSDHERMSSQGGQDHLTDEQMSLMMSSRKENLCLQNNDEPNEDFSSSAGMPLSSLDQANMSFSTSKVPATERTVEEFDKLVALWRSYLECEICHQLVGSYSQLKEHFSKNHGSEICYLMCCQMRLETRYDIDRHIHYHNAPQQLKCEACCKVYPSEQKLRSHKRNVHNRKGRDKNAENGLKSKGKYSCCKCSKDFATEQHLKKHNRNVHKSKILECNFCEKCFTRSYLLRQHLASHKGEKTYACTVCPKAFSWRSNFCYHMSKSHPEEWKKMQIEEAQREPKCKYRRETRGESMVFVCIYCSKEYDNRHSVYQHAKRCQIYGTPVQPKKGFRLETRGKNKVHVCIHCAKEFEKRRSMYHHLNQCHGDDGSLVKEQASMISEPLVTAEKVDIEPELNKNPEEAQQEGHGVKGLGIGTEDSIRMPTSLTFDIKSEEPLDLNSDHEGMSSQDGQDHLMVSSRKENSSLPNDDEVVSNEDYSSSDDMPLSSFRQTNSSSSKRKVPATKKSVEEFDELVALWRSSLKCDICHQLVASYSQLKEHFTKNHALEGCYLMCCQLRLETRFDIDRHIRFHNAPQQLKCETCCKVYRREQHLKRHNRIVHTSKGEDNIAKNKDIEKVQGKYRCCKCSKDFATEQRLKKHNRNVHKPKTFECNLCENSFRRPDALREHLADHRGEKKHVCSFCSKAFTWRTNFSRHMRECHLQELTKPAQSGIMRGYRQETRGESIIYVCNYCSREYEKRFSIYSHIRRCQGNDTPIEPKKGYRRETRGEIMFYICIFCSKEYECGESMRYHLYNFHRHEASLAKQPPTPAVQQQTIHNRRIRSSQSSVNTRIIGPKTTDDNNITPEELGKEGVVDSLISPMEGRTNVRTEQFSAGTNDLGNEEMVENQMSQKLEDPAYESEEYVKSEEEFIDL
uniref:Uncharacterized protein n=1 Tax=Stomoxys calcitrans TaxID=35570 RepID=A0A1I8PJW3_STOCA